MKRPLCIYHGNCADGFGAAWSVWKALGDNADYCAASHGDAPPDCRGREVIIVDFSYPRELLERLAEEASRLVLLDHHQSAERQLAPLLASGLIEGEFDMDRSGAMMAWQWFHPEVAAPQLLRHIEDRDLWRFALAGTREITAALFSYPQEFELWDRLMTGDIGELRRDGEAIYRKHCRDVESLCRTGRHRLTILGHEVPVVNAPPAWTSDAGELLGRNEPFAACYWDTGEHRAFSLRSAPDGLDVAEIAQAFGGGGHRHAAGFRLPMDQLSLLATGRK